MKVTESYDLQSRVLLYWSVFSFFVCFRGKSRGKCQTKTLDRNSRVCRSPRYFLSLQAYTIKSSFTYQEHFSQQTVFYINVHRNLHKRKGTKHFDYFVRSLSSTWRLLPSCYTSFPVAGLNLPTELCALKVLLKAVVQRIIMYVITIQYISLLRMPKNTFIHHMFRCNRVPS